MKAILLTKSGGLDEFQIQEVPDPDLKEDEVLIKVKATVVNGSDIIERKIFSGERRCLGLECSGTIEKIGKEVQRWNINDEVCVFVGEGGYAEKVAVPEQQVFPLPMNLTLRSAACLPLAACTVWSELFTTSKLSPLTFWLPKNGGPRLSTDETLLVHEDSNGIASFAIQLPKCKRVTTFVISRKEDYEEYYRDLGADKCFDYKDFIARDDKALCEGVDVILDVLGPEHFQRNLSCLNQQGGRLISIGNFLTNTMDATNSLPKVADEKVSRRMIIGAAAFRHRSRQSKELIVREVQENVWPLIENNMLKPSFHSKIFTFSQVKEAHQLMESSQHFEKILLVPDDA